jgi:hypothetical protein
MRKPGATPDSETQLTQACARRDSLVQSLLAMNGGNTDLYAGMGQNEGYDSLLCALRGVSCHRVEPAFAASVEPDNVGIVIRHLIKPVDRDQRFACRNPENP